MKSVFANLKTSTLMSVLLVLPFMIMEVINRRNFDEDFPFMLFFGMWLNLFAISLILLPMLRARQAEKDDRVSSFPTPGNISHTKLKSKLTISGGLLLSVVILSLLVFLGREPLERLLNRSNPELVYVFGVRFVSPLIALVLFSLPIAAGILAGNPIARTLQTGGGLFAHPVNLIIVIIILFALVLGFASLVVDQWPCFIGLPNCD